MRLVMHAIKHTREPVMPNTLWNT